MEYISEVWINIVRFYPKALRKLLAMYEMVRDNTDFGYDIDYLNTCFGDAGLSGYKDSMPG